MFDKPLIFIDTVKQNSTYFSIVNTYGFECPTRVGESIFSYKKLVKRVTVDYEAISGLAGDTTDPFLLDHVQIKDIGVGGQVIYYTDEDTAVRWKMQEPQKTLVEDVTDFKVVFKCYMVMRFWEYLPFMSLSLYVYHSFILQILDKCRFQSYSQ